jgi:hypothetical protein
MGSPIVVTYLVYLAITISITVWVAQTLFKNGRVFLLDVFHGDDKVADSVNHLLVVGFYLVNLGYVSLMLRIGSDIPGPREAIEALSAKVGLVLLILGGMHFLNLYIFSKIRAHRLQENWQAGFRRAPVADLSGTAIPQPPHAR